MSRGLNGQIRYDRSGNRCHFLNGLAVSREVFDQAFPTKEPGTPLPAATKTCWPLKSEALAVHPDQVAEANASLKKNKIAAEYDAAGFCHLSGRAARKELLRLEGFHDKKGGYGD